MDDDPTFRLAILSLVVIFAPIAFYHRLRSATDEKLDRRQEGVFILFGLRLSAGIALVGGVAWLINSQWLAWAAVPLPLWLRWLGIGLVACSGLLVVWTFRTLGKNLTDTVVTRRDHTLVTHGPYRYVRHPFYVAFALNVLGGGLATANLFLLTTSLLPLGFVVVRTRIEEVKLIQRFGADYQEYMQRVGRFWPRWRPWK